MKSFKSILCLFVAFVFLFISCKEESVINQFQDQQEFVIFEELTDLIPDNFDPQNEVHIKSLLAEVDDDLLEKLHESSIIVNYLEDNNFTTNHIEMFGKKLPTVDAVKSILNPSQLRVLKDKVSNENLVNRNDCTEEECAIVGWFVCSGQGQPLLICPIVSCTTFDLCLPNQICINGQCKTNPCTYCLPNEICVNYKCIEPCDNCLPYEICVDGRCVPSDYYKVNLVQDKDKK